MLERFRKRIAEIFYQPPPAPVMKIEANPPQAEISLTDPLMWPKGSMPFPYNPDQFAMRKGGMILYDKMRRYSMVKSCQWLKRLAVLCTGWDIEPVSEENADVEVSDFVREVFQDLKGTLEETIKQVLSGMDYGFSVSEKIWQVIPEGDWKGKWGYKAIKTRKPHAFDFDCDEFGNLRPQGIWQLSGRYKYDPAKFVIYTHNKEFQNWYGVSDLQAIYPHWWSIDLIIRWWNMQLERHGMGIPFLHPAPDKGNIPEPMFTSLKNALFNLQGGSAIAMQSGDAVIDILESKAQGGRQNPYLVAIEYHDRGIARGLLMPTGLGFTGGDTDKGGSLARSKKHFDLWLWVMNDLRSIAEESIMQEQLVVPLVDYNFTVNKYPKFRFNPLEDEEVEGLMKLWLDAIAGKAVHPTADDENHFRKTLGFPERDQEELTEEWEADKEAKDELKQARIDGLKGHPQSPSSSPSQSGPGGPGKPAGATVLPFQPEGKEKQMARKWHRDLTKVEKRFDFSATEKALDGLEADTQERLVAILKKQQTKLTDKVKRALEADKLNKNWIRSLQLQYGVEFQNIVGEYIRSVFDLGRNDAAQLVAKARGKDYQAVIKMPPKQAIERLAQDRFWIKGVVFDGILKDVQSILIQALDSGEGMTETMQKIAAVYAPYLGDKQILKDDKQIQPHRIETLIRTNGTRAYNTGMMTEYNDPDLDGFVRAVQVSAILDTRTTDICRHADGKIFMLDDPMAGQLTPPLHFNCRTVLIPVTEADGEFTPSTSLQLAEVKQLMPPDFGGSFDKVGGRARKEILGGFIAAKNVREAEEFAIKNLMDLGELTEDVTDWDRVMKVLKESNYISYEGMNLKQINAINEAIFNAKEKGFALPEKILSNTKVFKEKASFGFSDFKTNIMGAEGKILHINPESYFWNESSEAYQEALKRKWFVDQSIEGYTNHELGHIHHWDIWQKQGKSFKDFRLWGSSRLPIDKTLPAPPNSVIRPINPEFQSLMDEVSEYAVSNKAEFVAEVNAGIMTGKKYSKKVMDIFYEAVGVEEWPM